MIECAGINITMVGKWSKRIFDPDWVARNIFESPTVSIEIALNPDLASIFRCEDKAVRVHTAADKVVFEIEKGDKETIDYAYSIAKRMYLNIGKAFVAGIGFNITYKTSGYDVDNVVKEDISYLNGIKVSASNINLKYEFDEYDINVLMNSQHDTTTFSFNQHYASVKFNYFESDKQIFIVLKALQEIAINQLKDWTLESSVDLKELDIHE